MSIDALNPITCPSCHALNPADHTYCGRCGAPLHTAIVAHSSADTAPPNRIMDEHRLRRSIRAMTRRRWAIAAIVGVPLGLWLGFAVGGHPPTARRSAGATTGTPVSTARPSMARPVVAASPRGVSIAAFRLPSSVAGRPQILGSGGEGGGPCGACPTEGYFDAAHNGADTYEYGVAPPIPSVGAAAFGQYSVLLYPTDDQANQANVTARTQSTSDGMGHTLPLRPIPGHSASGIWLKGAVITAYNGGDNASCQADMGGRYGRVLMSVTIINYHSPHRPGGTPCGREYVWTENVLRALQARVTSLVGRGHGDLSFVVPPTVVPPTPTPMPFPTSDAQISNSIASDEGGTGPTAECNDGTTSYSQHPSGTCSHHGGVAVWDDHLSHSTP